MCSKKRSLTPSWKWPETKKLRRAEAAVEYERVLAEWFGVKHAIAVSSGTTALHIALAAFGIGPGDEVIVSPYTFVASDTAVLEQNAIPIFADIDPVTLTLDPDDIARRITPRTKAIIPVTISGTLVDMDPIMELARKHNLWVLEDACQSLGATYKGKMVGTIGDVGVFSTITGKIINTGEGGFVITNDTDLYEKMWGYHGLCPQEISWSGIQISLGIALHQLPHHEHAGCDWYSAGEARLGYDP